MVSEVKISDTLVKHLPRKNFCIKGVRAYFNDDDGDMSFLPLIRNVAKHEDVFLLCVTDDIGLLMIKSKSGAYEFSLFLDLSKHDDCPLDIPLTYFDPKMCRYLEVNSKPNLGTVYWLYPHHNAIAYKFHVQPIVLPYLLEHRDCILIYLGTSGQLFDMFHKEDYSIGLLLSGGSPSLVIM